MANEKDNPEEGLTRTDIEKLIDVIHQKGIEEFELEQGGTRLRIVSAGRQGSSVPQPTANSAVQPGPLPSQEVAATSSTPGGDTEEDPNLKKVTSPMVGTFYRSPSPGSKPFVEVGDKVDEDSVLCIIEAMKLMNEIKAEMRGVVRKILVENAQPVEYGQAIYLIEPS